MRNIKVGNVVFGQKKKFVFIGGPCVIESETSALYHAEKLIDISSQLNIPFVYKSSYDKANRSSLSSYRGPGIVKGLAILEKIKKKYAVPIVSDVH